jgi:uncharacterized protein (DUF362 family)/Pyruvate/2-oxoacid:ferredoxin oxidoreductase delta subunit
MKKKVILLKIEEYQHQLIYSKLKKAIQENFSLKELYPTADKILLKPNLLIPVPAKEAITTHPAVISAVGCILKDMGFSVSIADNPSVFNTQNKVSYVYQQTGVSAIAGEYGFNLLYPEKSYIREGIPLSWWSKDFAIVNIAKAKTHSLTTLTLAVKNLYGCISGAHKSYLHRCYPRPQDFIKVLLQLYCLLKPPLSIIDGVVSLQGEGPASNGEPVKTNFIALGNDALALDKVVSNYLGVAQSRNPLINKAVEAGLVDEDIEVISEFRRQQIKGFSLPKSSSLNYLPNFLLRLASNCLKIRPAVNKKICVGCGDCQRICPAAAVTIENGKACIKRSKCILCMCCSEVCRFNAIDSKRSFFLKLI